MSSPGLGTRLLGFVLIVAVIGVGWFVVQAPRVTTVASQAMATTPQTPPAVPAPREAAHPEPPTPVAPPPPAPVVPTVQMSFCHSIGEGALGASPVFGDSSASQVHANYFYQGGPELDVILPGGVWTRAEGVDGHFWVFADCTNDEVLYQVQQHQGRRGSSWGDASLFSRGGA